MNESSNNVVLKARAAKDRKHNSKITSLRWSVGPLFYSDLTQTQPCLHSDLFRTIIVVNS